MKTLNPKNFGMNILDKFLTLFSDKFFSTLNLTAILTVIFFSVFAFVIYKHTLS